jgi:hypothetical protein
MSQLVDPFNVNFRAKGVESNGQWTKIPLDSTPPASSLIQNWSSVAVSTDGQFVIACVNEGQIFTSSNYGYSMIPDTDPSLPSSATWSGVTISCDGTKAAACVKGGGIYTATLNTTTLTWNWTLTSAPTAAWSSITFSVETIMDSGGSPQIVSNYIAACINNPNPSGSEIYGIYYAINSETTWNWNQTDAPEGDWSSITYLNLVSDELNWVASMYLTGEIYLSKSSNPYYWSLLYAINSGNFSCVSSSGISNNANTTPGGKIFVSTYNNLHAGIYIGTYNTTDSSWSWVESNAPINLAWSSIASSSTGQYVVACVNGGGIYCSLDYGNTWTEQVNGVSNPSAWKCVASDSTGSFLVGAVSDGYIYISPYFQGIQWNSSFNIANISWDSVASDGSGKNLIAGSITTSLSYVYVSHDYGITWSAVNTLGTNTWTSVASNSDGSILGAVASSGAASSNTLGISRNYGVDWTTFSTTAIGITSMGTVSFDSSGDYVVLGTKSNSISLQVFIGIYDGTTYNWSNTNLPSTIYLTALTISGDASTIYACVYTTGNVSNNTGGIWVGTNSGGTVTWSNPLSNVPKVAFRNISCSTNGRYLIVCNSFAPTNATSLYYSSSYCSQGQGFSYFIPPSAFPSGMPIMNSTIGFYGATMDTSGTKMAVTINGGYTVPVYMSIDGGKTWVSQIQGLPLSGPQGQMYWQTIACNGNMDRLIVGGREGSTIYSVGIYTSFISETSWTPQLNALPSKNVFSKLTSSSDGKYLAVVAENTTNLVPPNPNNDYGGIWISSDSGSTWIQSTAGNLCWNAIASDNTGQYLVAGVYGGQLYTSSNYGLNWTVVASSPVANWVAISFSCNSDNTVTNGYVFAQANGGNVYYSKDRGTTWTVILATGAWSNGIASSSDGYYAYSCVLNNTTTSSPYGIYVTYMTSPTATPVWIYPALGLWNYIATDSTGQYVVAVDLYVGIYFSSDYGSSWNPILSQNQYWNAITLVKTETKLLVNAICSYGLIYSGNCIISSITQVPPTGTWTWTFNSTTSILPSTTWNDIHASSDGTHLVLCSTTGGIWTSTNNGATWTQSTAFYTNYNTSITSSSTGQNLAAIINNGPIYTSSNYGSTWSQLTSNTLPTFTNWYSITSSITGQYIVASTTIGEMYVSSNYGQTWITSIIGANPVVSISSSGQYVVAATYLGTIYISSNYGVAWSQLTEEANGLPSVSEAWSAIAMSCTGQYIAATINGGTIYISSNFGSNWTSVSITAAWSSIAISNTGQNMVAAINIGTIYISSNYGLIWVAPITPSAAWSAVAISGTGQYMFATINGSVIYYSSSYGTIWIEGPTTADGSLPPTSAWTGITSSTSGQYLAAIAPNSNSTTDIYIYSNFMDIGNIFGSLINQLQILAQKQN